jgi:hypothetical protein
VILVILHWQPIGTCSQFPKHKKCNLWVLKVNILNTCTTNPLAPSKIVDSHE